MSYLYRPAERVIRPGRPPIDGWLEFGGGTGLGTVSTVIYLMAGSFDNKATLSAAPQRVVLPRSPSGIEIVGYKLVIASAGVGAATITAEPRLNGVASGKLITWDNTGVIIASASWEGDPLVVPDDVYVDVGVTKSTTVTSSGVGLGLALAYRWRS